MGDFGAVRDKWVCPNDRELSLRAKLRTGWSVKTNSINSFNKPVQLNDAEQEVIMSVIKRAENLEKVEQERIGRLVERLENMKKNAMGNGATQCVLCADEFGILGASPLLCNDCKKAVCTKCGVDTVSAHKEPIWLCKICAETRETWKKSGAWFYKGLPKYILPERKEGNSKYSNSASRGEHMQSPQRSFNSWLQSKGRGTSEKENTDSSDDELKCSRLAKRATTRKAFTESVESNEASVATAMTPPMDTAGPSPTYLNALATAAVDPPRSPQQREDGNRQTNHETYMPYSKTKWEEGERSQTPTATASHWSRTGGRRDHSGLEDYSDRTHHSPLRKDGHPSLVNRHRPPPPRMEQPLATRSSPEESSKRSFRKKKKRRK